MYTVYTHYKKWHIFPLVIMTMYILFSFQYADVVNQSHGGDIKQY